MIQAQAQAQAQASASAFSAFENVKAGGALTCKKVLNKRPKNWEI